MEAEAMSYVQSEPNVIAFNEFLTWIYLQQKKFNMAFVQAKAIDNRMRLSGYGIYDIGIMAYEHKDYKAAMKIFEYLCGKYPMKGVYPMAKNMLVKTKEEDVKNTYPVDMGKIESLISEYQQVIEEIGQKDASEAVQSMAKLYAFYKGEHGKAIGILENMVKEPGLQPKFVAETKLIIGDIYLLKNEPWESTLLYSQVEKSEKGKELGHLSKLKNARLSYFTGNFELAKSHLDILKLATSREIANDAMELSLFIQDNLDLDTTDVHLKAFAEAEFAEYQNIFGEALSKYRQLYDKLEESHSLKDELLMKIAILSGKIARYDEKEKALLSLLENHGDDILADDANFFLAKLYEENLNEMDKAMEHYRKQMTDFPGSIYVVEARKRFRALRGDKL
jgi:tetratricopeptide (TPR) repeat protein